MSGSGRRIAVVLFNLGGPDDQASVRPFLFNLFRDPAIIGLPDPFRTWLAGLISSRRESQRPGQLRPDGRRLALLAETRKQAAALEQSLASRLPATRSGPSSPCATGPP
jgi:ferrochelatase